MRLLIPDSEKRSVVSLYTDTETNLGEAIVGGVIELEVGRVSRLATPTGPRQWAGLDLTGWSLIAAIGIPFEPSIAGSFNVTLDGATTAQIDFDATPAEVATALQALTLTVAATIAVSGGDGLYIVNLRPVSNHSYAQMTSDPSDLAPLSVVETGILVSNNGLNPWEQIHTIRVAQNAAAKVDLDIVSAAAGGSVTVLQVGGGGQNAKVRVKLFTDPAPGFPANIPYDGRWSLTKTAVESALLAWDISDTDLATALAAVSTIGTGNVSVFREEIGSYLIGFQGALANTDVGTITIDTTALRVLDTRCGVLDLRTPGMNVLLGNQTQVSAFFEVEGTPPAGLPQKLYRQPITVVAPVIDPATLTPQPIALFDTSDEVDDKIFVAINAQAESFLPSVTGYTGGGSTKLDGVATVGVSVNRLYKFVHVTEGLRFYELVAGTDAEASPGIIHPDDYNGSTNAKVFKSVL